MSATPPSRRHQSQLPMTATAFREELWRRAGVSLTERAEALGEAFRKARSLLNAKRVELVSYQGEVQQVELEDPAAQLRAAAEIFDLSGAKVGRSEHGPSVAGSVQITINAPWFQPESTVTDITPKPAEGDTDIKEPHAG